MTINCGAIPENLLESELFGHVRGAFTGAVRDHQGFLEAADGGTLFLDEVGEIPPAAQVKLLRFLQEGESRRVGDTKVRKFDVRIIAATNRNLEEAVRDGSFREDLFFRLNVIPIFLPPLRERKEDIPPLAAHLLQRLCDAHSRNVTGLSPEALRAFMNYRWPGNVREMENVIEYALHLTDEGNPIRRNSSRLSCSPKPAPRGAPAIASPSRNIPDSPSSLCRRTIPKSRSPRSWGSAGRTCGRNGSAGTSRGRARVSSTRTEGPTNPGIWKNRFCDPICALTIPSALLPKVIFGYPGITFGNTIPISPHFRALAMTFLTST